MGFSDTIRAMSARHALRHALLAVLAFAGCGKASGVELRLYPCALPGGDPSDVVVTIQPHGSDGEALGSPLERSFAIADPSVLSDDYATVKFIPPAGTATADITLTWSVGGVEAVAMYTQVAVPHAGGAIVLGSEECEGTDGSTGEPSSTSTGEGTSTDGTGTGTESSGGTTGGSSTGDGSTTETGTTWDSTTDASTSSTSETTGGTTGGPMEGGPCDMPDVTICDGGPGVLGEFLKCIDGTWQKVDNNQCDVGTACPPELGLENPELAGCLGDGTKWTCACADLDAMMVPKTCPVDGVSACGEMVGDAVAVELCVTEGDELVHYVGLCPKCSEVVPGEPLCEYFE